MAVVNEALVVCGSILQIVSKIENFKEDWFTVSVEYQSQAVILRSKLKFYGEQVRIHGQPEDSTMVKTLTKAQLTLLKAELRLSKLEEKVESDPCCFPGWWLYAKLSLTLFPEKLEKVFKKLIDEIESIPKTLRDEAEIATLMQQADQRRANPTTIQNNDSLYVPIEKSQSAVMKAIEDFQSPSIVLLHGGVGKGKSTLARYVNERYGKYGDVEKRNLFEHVILVACGHTSIPDPSTKQFEILELLSPDSLGTSQQKEKHGSKSRIAKALRDFLNGKKILVILDDVSDARFLYEMWKATNGGRDVKFLVTSQSSSLCGSLKNESLLIAMEDPTKDEAKMILASLVGLVDKVIPSELQVIADKMIETTEGNPLALACLASNFTYSRDNADKRAWQDAYKVLRKLLDNPEDKIVLGHNESTPRSLWAAMKICMDSLETSDAKVILFLMYACKGESIPEEVLRILHAHIKTSSSTFTKSREELLMRELVKSSYTKAVSNKTDGKDEMQPMSTTLSIRSLVKLYLEHHMVNKEEIRSVIGALADDDESAPESSLEHEANATETRESEKTGVAMTLCALYFDHGHTDQAVRRVVTQASQKSNLSDSDDSINDLRKKAIEPLVWLLDQPEEEEQWTESDICCARKVLLKYICSRELDDENITHLLKLVAFPFAQVATLMAISRICRLEEAPLLKDNNLTFLKTLTHILVSKEGPISVVEAASTTLRDICWKTRDDQSTLAVATTPGVLDTLISSLSFPTRQSDSIAENGASALSSLLYLRDDISNPIQQDVIDSITKKIVNTEGALASLVNILYEYDKPALQKQGAWAMTNLAATTDNSLKWRIANEERAIAGLVKLLYEHDKEDLQKEGAWAMKNLAATTDNSLKWRIVNEDGALAGLVKLLYEQGKPTLQKEALEALGNLVDICCISDEKTTKARGVVKGVEGLLEALSSLLVEGVLPDIQFVAAQVLTKIDPKFDKDAILHSELAYKGRAHAYIGLGMLREALRNLDQASNLEEPTSVDTLCYRCLVKAKLGDLKGALEDANAAVQANDNLPFALQERGILKLMMGDLEGALADLDAGLELETDDYERLKHRGYVKFLLKDEAGARADAEWAMRIKPSYVGDYDYGSGPCLGTTPAEYLGYKLK